MRRIFAIVLVLCMCVSLIACSNKKDNGDEVKNDIGKIETNEHNEVDTKVENQPTEENNESEIKDVEEQGDTEHIEKPTTEINYESITKFTLNEKSVDLVSMSVEDLQNIGFSIDDNIVWGTNFYVNIPMDIARVARYNSNDYLRVIEKDSKIVCVSVNKGDFDNSGSRPADCVFIDGIKINTPVEDVKVALEQRQYAEFTNNPFTDVTYLVYEDQFTMLIDIVDGVVSTVILGFENEIGDQTRFG